MKWLHMTKQMQMLEQSVDYGTVINCLLPPETVVYMRSYIPIIG